MIPVLFKEASLVNIQVALLKAGNLRRYIMDNKDPRQTKIFSAWEDYKQGNLSPKSLLQKLSHVHGPVIMD